MEQHTRLLQVLEKFFPGTFSRDASYLQRPDVQRMLLRIQEAPSSPITLTHFNQLLHLNHEAGVTEGFFKYYFLEEPLNHPYPVDKTTPRMPDLNPKGISTLEQLEWGLQRFFLDALLYHGNIREAYRDLRMRCFTDISTFFESHRLPREKMQSRGPFIPLRSIPNDDRYLISETACKAYDKGAAGDKTHIEEILLDAYSRNGQPRVRISKLFDSESQLAKDAPDRQMMLQLAAEEFMDDVISNEEELR